MHVGEQLFSIFKRAIYSLAAFALVAISLAMIGAAGLDVLHSMDEGLELKRSLLDGIGLMVVALAVFDVAKYLMEQEVLRDRELRSAAEARETLTKFIVIIVIALTLEALVFVLGAASEHLSLLVYPAILFAVAAVMIVALAVYLRLSGQLEARLDEDPVPLANGRRPDRRRNE